MPRVIPSQVVAVIEQWFPLESQGMSNFSLGRQHAGQLMAIIDLVRQIPEELITVGASDYNDLVVGINIIQGAFPQWQMRNYTISSVPGYGNTSPLTLIHQALSKCPDQSPSPATAELSFIRPDDPRENLRLDISAANRALANNEWKAATLLAGSIVEALLLWALQQRLSEKLWEAVERLRKKNDPATGKPILGRKPDNDLKNWVLHDFIEVGLELGVVTAETAARARLGKDFRNLIHPGRALRLEQVCDRGTALSAVAAVEFVVRDLTP